MCGRVPGPLDVCSGLCSGGGMGARQKELWKVWRSDWRLSVLRRAPATRSDPTKPLWAQADGSACGGTKAACAGEVSVF